jgi:cytidylate kinase
MTIITLSRELGSNGTTIARQVAGTLGYRFVDKRTFERILQQYGLVEFEELYDSAPGFWARFDSSNLQIVAMLNKTILGIARLGDVVILGRGGYAALRGYADVMHVRIQAPFSLRVQRVVEDQGLDVEDAATLVAQNDKARAMFVKGFYDADYYTASQFHMVLDTAVVPVERATAWIVEAAKALADRSPDDALTTRAIEVDPVLASAISDVLEIDSA